MEPSQPNATDQQPTAASTSVSQEPAPAPNTDPAPAQPPQTPQAHLQPARRKNKNKQIVTAAIIVIVAIPIIIVAGWFTLSLLLGHFAKPLQGHWSCNDNTEIEFDGSHFDMSTRSTEQNIQVSGEYKVVEMTSENGYTEYTLNLSTTDRYLNGEHLTEPYTTQYAISMSADAETEMVMMNTVSSSLYFCSKTR